LPYVLPGDVIFVLLGVKTLGLLAYVMPFSLALGIVTGVAVMLAGIYALRRV